MNRVFVRLLIIGTAISTFVTPAMAATPTPAPGGGQSGPGQGLEISPPVIELNANPGQTVTATIRVRNVASGILIAKGRADDFGAGASEDGQPKILIDEAGSERYSLKKWITSVPDLRLAPQELKATTVTIRVPTNAEPGGHFGVVRFTAVPPELEGTGVALSASIGTLVLLRVSGDIKEKLSVASLQAGQLKSKGKDGSKEFKTGSFFETGPVSILARIKNEGTVHEKPQGTLEVKDTFGNKIASLPMNERGGNVLPDSIRRFESEIGQKRLFGRYTVTLNATYSEGKQKLTASSSFWVIPWKLILLVILVIVLLVIGLRWALKRYNAYIIQQARRK